MPSGWGLPGVGYYTDLLSDNLAITYEWRWWARGQMPVPTFNRMTHKPHTLTHTQTHTHKST